MWKQLAKFCTWMYVHEVRAKTRRNKRQIEIDAELSSAWDPRCNKGLGSRELYTIELSQWLINKGDRATIDELVDFIYAPRQFIVQSQGLHRNRRRRH